MKIILIVGVVFLVASGCERKSAPESEASLPDRFAKVDLGEGSQSAPDLQERTLSAAIGLASQTRLRAIAFSLPPLARALLESASCFESGDAVICASPRVGAAMAGTKDEMVFLTADSHSDSLQFGDDAIRFEDDHLILVCGDTTQRLPARITPLIDKLGMPHDTAQSVGYSIDGIPNYILRVTRPFAGEMAYLVSVSDENLISEKIEKVFDDQRKRQTVYHLSENRRIEAPWPSRVQAPIQEGEHTLVPRQRPTVYYDEEDKGKRMEHVAERPSIEALMEASELAPWIVSSPCQVLAKLSGGT